MRRDQVVEKITPAVPGVCYPRCTAGRGIAPEEDSGGIWAHNAPSESDNPSEPFNPAEPTSPGDLLPDDGELPEPVIAPEIDTGPFIDWYAERHSDAPSPASSARWPPTRWRCS